MSKQSNKSFLASWKQKLSKSGETEAKLESNNNQEVVAKAVEKVSEKDEEKDEEDVDGDGGDCEKYKAIESRLNNLLADMEKKNSRNVDSVDVEVDDSDDIMKYLTDDTVDCDVSAENEIIEEALDAVKLEKKYGRKLVGKSSSTSGGKLDDDGDLERRIANLRTGNPFKRNQISRLEQGPIEIPINPKMADISMEKDDSEPEMCSLCDLDAQIKCLDEECEDDNLFCLGCWKITHLGPDAYEPCFKNHKNKKIG